MVLVSARRVGAVPALSILAALTSSQGMPHSGQPAGGIQDGQIELACAHSLRDLSDQGQCIRASSVPTLGTLCPLGPDWFIDPGTGFTGLGTTVPTAPLTVRGRYNGFDYDGIAVKRTDAELVGAIRPTAIGAGILEVYSGEQSVGVEVYGGNGTVGGGLVRVLNADDEIRGQMGVDISGNGLMMLFDIFGNPTVELDSGSRNGALILRESPAGAPSDRVVLLADGPSSGGTLWMNNDGGTVTCLLTAGAESAHFTMSDVDGEDTIELIADDGAQGGRLLLKDRNGTNDFAGAELRGRDVNGGGGLLLLRNGNGDEVLDFDANAGATPTNTGVYVLRENDTSPAWRFSGDLFQGFNHAGVATISYDRVTGSKNAVVQTEHHGPRTLYCLESTGVWFEDFGRGRVQDGEGRVELDPVFLETVTIDDGHPLQVTVTPTSLLGGFWVEKGPGHFVVHSEHAGTFDWRVAAKRKGLEDLRLEPYAEE